jgi:hypothetical protein
MTSHITFSRAPSIIRDKPVCFEPHLKPFATLSPAHGNLRLPLVVHAQLVAGLEPRHRPADVVDVHHESTARG